MRILAVDFGDARTGLAICDLGEMLAFPTGVIQEKRFEQTVRKTAESAKEMEADRILVGFPKNMDGSIGPRAQLCAEFARQLEELVDIPVSLWDERQTTISANYYLNQTDTRGKKRKGKVDALAATIILESYLLWKKHHPDMDIDAMQETLKAEIAAANEADSADTIDKDDTQNDE